MPTLYRCEDIAARVEHRWFAGFMLSVLQPGISVTCAKLYLPFEEEKKLTPGPEVLELANARYVQRSGNHRPVIMTCRLVSSSLKIGNR
jgi:hypothetical protein